MIDTFEPHSAHLLPEKLIEHIEVSFRRFDVLHLSGDVDHLHCSLLCGGNVVYEHLFVCGSNSRIDCDFKLDVLASVDPVKQWICIVFIDEAHHSCDQRLEKALVEASDDVGHDLVTFLSEDRHTRRSLRSTAWKALRELRDTADFLHFHIEA